MVKIFKFRSLSNSKNSDQNSTKPSQNGNGGDGNNGGIYKILSVVWIVFLVANFLNLANELEFSSQICAILWFLLSFALIVFIYKFGLFGVNLARAVMVFVAFCAGFFASALYYGSIAQNAFEFGGVCALLALFFSFGFAVII